MIKKSVIFLLVLMVLVVFIFAAGPLVTQSEKGFPDLLPKWFPSIFRDKTTYGEDPAKTLQAPFISAEQVQGPLSAPGGLGDLYQEEETEESTEDIATSHRPAIQVGDWLKQQVTFIMSFAPEAYPQHRREIRKLMSAKGYEEFEKFLASTNLLGALKNGNRDLHSYILDNPELIHSAPVNGRYRWLFAAPVNITLVPKGSTNYEQDVNSLNKQILIQIQVGRVDSEANDGMLIESWQIRKR